MSDREEAAEYQKAGDLAVEAAREKMARGECANTPQVVARHMYELAAKYGEQPGGER